MSTLNVANISDGTDTVETGYVVNGSAKAWVYGTDAAVPVESLNISSGTDNGTGDYTYTVSTAMSSTNSGILASSRVPSNLPYSTVPHTVTTTTVRVRTWRAYDAVANNHRHTVSFLGDLA